MQRDAWHRRRGEHGEAGWSDTPPPLPCTRDLRLVRSHPEVVAWRKVLVDAAEMVHECHIWLRATRKSTVRLFDATNELGFPYQTPQPPSKLFLDLCPKYAVAQMHRAVASGSYPTLAALLGPTRCARG